MISLDANLLLYSYNADSPRHTTALSFLTGLAAREDVAISEFVLVEFYTLLRNPAVLVSPLPAGEAVRVIQAYRRHPNWALVGFGVDSGEVHNELWVLARRNDFARRKIYDARIALSLRRQGVTDFATVNVKDFKHFGFHRVWNPLDVAQR